MRHVLIPLSLSDALPPPGTVLHELSGEAMGSSWSAKVMAPHRPGSHAQLKQLLQRELDLVVSQMSHWERDSDLSRYNSAPGGSWQRLPDELFEVLQYALTVAADTGGAYDPCAGALVNAWGFGARRRYDEPQFYAPDAAAVDALVARADRSRVQLDAVGRRLLQPGGVQLDLSSVAKGYAVDRLARCLVAQGLEHHLVEAGGELRGAGVKGDGQPWWVELEGVPGAEHGAPTLVALHGLAVATSGDYRRYFNHGSGRAAHTLDPRSGWPVASGVASVTVLHRDCMAADALSTALTVLGPEHGLAFAEQHRLTVRYLLRRGGRIEEVFSSAFAAMLS